MLRIEYHTRAWWSVLRVHHRGRSFSAHFLVSAGSLRFARFQQLPPLIFELPAVSCPVSSPESVSVHFGPTAGQHVLLSVVLVRDLQVRGTLINSSTLFLTTADFL
jgi:hypothetical protein